MKNRKGFTLIELIIVIVIIGILASISVPIYRGYTRRAMAAEGRSLVGSLSKAEKIYYAEHTKFNAQAGTANDTVLGVDATMNKYFTNFTVTVAGGSAFTAATSGLTGGDASGITVSLTQAYGSAPTVTDNSNQ